MATTNTAKFKATIRACITVLLTAKPTTERCKVRSNYLRMSYSALDGKHLTLQRL